jgi:hypothetical protein
MKKSLSDFSMQEIHQNSLAKKLQTILGTRKLEISLAQKIKDFQVLKNKKTFLT